MIRSEDTLMHKAERPSSYLFSTFTHYQAEQIKQGVIYVQILLEIHQTEHCKSIFKVEQLHLHIYLGL